MVTALEGAAASEARGGLGNDRTPHKELHREDLLSCVLPSLPFSLSEALLPSFKCRTSPRLFDGPLAELTLIKQLNPPASLVVRSLCVQKRTLHGAALRGERRPSERACGRQGDRRSFYAAQHGQRRRRPRLRPSVRPPGVYVTQSTHSVFQSLRSAVFACPGAGEGRGQPPRPLGGRPACRERGRGPPRGSSPRGGLRQSEVAEGN